MGREGGRDGTEDVRMEGDNSKWSYILIAEIVITVSATQVPTCVQHTHTWSAMALASKEISPHTLIASK